MRGTLEKLARTHKVLARFTRNDLLLVRGEKFNISRQIVQGCRQKSPISTPKMLQDQHKKSPTIKKTHLPMKMEVEYQPCLFPSTLTNTNYREENVENPQTERMYSW